MVNDTKSPRQRRRTHLADTVDTSCNSTAAIAATTTVSVPFAAALPLDKRKKRRPLVSPRTAAALRKILSFLFRPVHLVIGLLLLFLVLPSLQSSFGSPSLSSSSLGTLSFSALLEPARTPIVFSRRVAGWKPTIILPQSSSSSSSSTEQPPLLLEPLLPDLGGLELTTLHHVPLPSLWKRVIDPNDATLFENDRNDFLKDIDGHISQDYEHKDEQNGRHRECVRNNWAWTPKPACNALHETAVSFDSHSTVSQAFGIKYLSHGYFRDTWIYKPADDIAEDDPDLVLKTLRFNEDHEFDYHSISKIEQEAVIMEGLTASDLIVDIYGYCSTSIIAEAMPGEITTAIVPGDPDDYDRGHIKQSDLDKFQKDDVFPLNNLTITEKLDLALLMSESLAELHGFHGGVIVHGDLHPDQYLKTADGRIKLNDFNNGHLLLWSPAAKDYCTFSASYGGGYKAPEEFTGEPSNEQVDTWAIGHGIFGLLTGLYPYYRTFSHTSIRKMVMEGKKPFVDDRYRNRSMVERRLIEIMEKCWEFKPNDRPEIYEVVKHIRETKRMYKEELANNGGGKRNYPTKTKHHKV